MQLRRARQRVAVDLQHLIRCHRIAGRIEVADVGEQELERVAHAPVSVDHARQNFFVAGNVARVVAGRDPQADDFGAQLLRGLLRINAVAGALAHLVALAVDREAVRQDALVGRAAVHGAGRQQRGMEPAAVLVMAFQIEVGLGAIVMAATRVGTLEHRGVCGAGVEPDFQNVAALGVVRSVGGAQDGLGCGLAPGFDAALLHHVGSDVEDLHRARVQLATVLVQEEG